MNKEDKKTCTPIVRVKDSQSARRLLSRLITQLQKGEVQNSDAKDLTYLLNNYIQISKYILESEEIVAILEHHILSFKNQWSIFFLKLIEDLEGKLDPKLLLEFDVAVKTAESQVNDSIQDVTRSICKEISTRTSVKVLKSAILEDKTDHLHQMILRAIDGLPKKLQSNLVTEINDLYG
ncbi:MAG: hypothetical protein KKA84_09335 [Bacteroidetes bacterium]|nr:hypothetical protein [Bacteroidota bacterium]